MGMKCDIVIQWYMSRQCLIGTSPKDKSDNDKEFS